MNQTSNDTCKDHHVYFQIFDDFLKIYYTLFLIVFGFMGNSMTIIIFWRTKFAHSLRTSYYLICLAITDTAFLLCLLLKWFGDMDSLPNSISPKKNSLLCKSSQYLGLVFNFVSCGLVLTFTMQRLCIIVFPLRGHKHTMESKSKIIVGLLIILGFGIYSYYPIMYDVIYDGDLKKTSCSIKSEYGTTAEIMNIVDSCITLIFPFFGLLIMNAIIIRTLKNSSYNFATRTSTTMRKISFKNRNHVDSANSNNNNNNENEDILEKKYRMCRCHQDQLKSVEAPLEEANRHDKRANCPGTLICCRFDRSVDRRNSVEMSSVTVKPTVQKKYLISYKLDKFNRLQKKEGETDNLNDSTNANNNCHNCTGSRSNRLSKYRRRCSKDEIQTAARSRKSSSLEISRGMSFRISGTKANTVSRKITKMLIIVSSTFLILNLPIHSFNLYSYVVMLDREDKSYSCVENYMRVISDHLFFTSFSCNFLLYSISGVMFRNECKKLIYKIFRINKSVH